MLKFGQLYLNNEKWNDQQILPENWVKESRINRGYDYGFQWWLSESEEYYSARGWGGQLIL